MKVEDLIQLLNNRSREFQLSRDYARMSGDLERMNAADKEIIALEDTLYQLNLLVDVSKSATVKEAVLAEAMTDGSVAVLSEYDITPYATDPLHEEKIMNILSKMAVMDTVEKIDNYIKGKYPSSPITGDMIMSASLAYTVDQRLMMAIMEQDSRFGTAGVAVRTLNPGNVGNDDDGNTRTYESWQEGVTAVAEWLSRHRGSTIIPETLEETFIEPVSTSTPSTLVPMATSTPLTATTTMETMPITNSTSTTTVVTPTLSTATSTPTTTATTTPLTVTSSQTSATTTPLTTTSTITTATSTPLTATTTMETMPITNSTSTTTIVTPTLSTATSTPTTTTATTSTTTPVTIPSTLETAPVTNSTSTTTVVTPTLSTNTSTPTTTTLTSTFDTAQGEPLQTGTGQATTTAN